MIKERNQNSLPDEINEHINNYKKKIGQIQKDINNSNNINQTIKLYKDILAIDNTEEKNILEYLLYLKNLEENKKGVSNHFPVELEKYQICISDANYSLYFKNKERKSARKKFQDFFEKIKNFSPVDKNSKEDFLIYIRNLALEIIKIDFHNNKKVTWDNEELYLTYLFNAWILSISFTAVDYYENIKNKPQIENNNEYIKLNEFLKKELEEKVEDVENKNELLVKKEENIRKIKFSLFNIALLNSEFYYYIANIHEFLIRVETTFNKKFGKLELDNINDKMLFEDFIHFLSTYDFKTTEYISYWNEIFVPLDEDDKRKILNPKIYFNFEINENSKKLEIYKYDEKISLNANIYCLNNLIDKSKYLTNIEDVKCQTDKYMRCDCFNEHLFVCQTRNHWKKL